MTDRELLEKAAKAEGHGVFFDDLSGLTWWYEGDDVASAKYVGLPWDPLHNDGDALRLVVKLNLRVCPSGVNGCASVWLPSGPWIDEIDPDVGAATRRAIVRAAAAIGEKT